jgi:outer membrane protein assembly factor BamB
MGSTASQNCFPEGIRDPDRPVAFVQTGNGVKAIRLLDGSPIWTDTTTGRPVALWENRIVVRVGLSQQSFRLDMLDMATGKLILRSEPASVQLGSAYAFSSMCPESAPASENKLTLRWHGTSHYGGGANPPPNMVAAESEVMMEANLDHSNGTLLLSAREVPESAPKAVMPEASYMRNGNLTDEPWETDGVSVRLGRKQHSCSLNLYVRKKGSPESIKEVRTNCAVKERVPYVTADGKYLAVEADEGLWNFYSVVDSREIGKIFARSLNEPCIVEDRVYYRSQEPLGVNSLVAQSLATGKLIWSLQLIENHSEHRPKLPQ